MTSSTIDIELIVQSVLKQIQDERKNSATTPATTTVSAPIKHLSQRVITADVLAAEAINGGQITVEQRAIITPTAQDYLKARQIQVTRASKLNKTAVQPAAVTASNSTPATTQKTASRWLLLMVETSAAFETALKSVQKQQQVSVTSQRATSTEEAATTAISEINRGNVDGILVISNRSALAACLSNRQERVRAAAVHRLADLPVLKEIQANVVCLPDKGPGVSDYLQILRQIFQTVHSR